MHTHGDTHKQRRTHAHTRTHRRTSAAAAACRPWARAGVAPVASWRQQPRPGVGRRGRAGVGGGAGRAAGGGCKGALCE